MSAPMCSVQAFWEIEHADKCAKRQSELLVVEVGLVTSSTVARGSTTSP